MSSVAWGSTSHDLKHQAVAAVPRRPDAQLRAARRQQDAAEETMGRRPFSWLPPSANGRLGTVAAGKAVSRRWPHLSPDGRALPCRETCSRGTPYAWNEGLAAPRLVSSPLIHRSGFGRTAPAAAARRRLFRANGIGICGYAWRSACAACMPRIHVIGERPLGVFRGDVTPPTTRLRWSAALSARYIGLRRRVTYRLGEFGRRNSCRFGSIQIVQRRIHGYLCDAA